MFSSSYVPRAPTLDGSPFMRPRKARSYTLPGIGAVKMRHAQAGALSSLEPERSDNNLITLEDFLAESEKTPNKVITLSGVLFAEDLAYSVTFMYE